MSAISSGLNILTQIYQQNSEIYLGNVSIFTIFVFGMLGNVFCVGYIHRLKFNISFFLHAIGYMLFMVGGVLISNCGSERSGICHSTMIWAITILGSAIGGFMSSGLFVTQNYYISKQSNNHTGMSFGVGWAFLQSSQIIGNLYSAYIIEPLGQFNFFLVMLTIGLVTSLGFLVTPNGTSKVHEQQINESFISKELSTLKEMILQKKPRYLFIPMMLTGVLLSFQWNVMHVLIELSINDTQSDEAINKATFLVMMVLGIAEVSGGLISGVLNSIYKHNKTLLFIFLTLEINLYLTLVNTDLKNYGVCFVIAALWGLVDCSTTANLLSLLSDDFDQDVRIFGVFNFMQCLGGMISTMMSIALSDQCRNVINQSFGLDYSIFNCGISGIQIKPQGVRNCVLKPLII